MISSNITTPEIINKWQRRSASVARSVTSIDPVIAGGVIVILIAALVGSSVKTLQSYQVGLHQDNTAITINESKLY